MKEDLKFTVYDELGNKLEYKILTTFMLISTKKHYIVYTDETYNKDNKLNTYVSIFDPNDDTVFEDVTNEFEWREINKVIGDNNVD